MGIEIIVVGAGVVGLSIARRLKLDGHDVLLLDRNPRAGMEVSSRNSEVIHAGLYYAAGSLRGRLCVEGRRKLVDFCQSAGVPFRMTGKLIVATHDDEIPRLDAIVASAEANGAPRLVRLSGADAREQEPELACVAALLSPCTGIVDTHQLTLALQAEFENAGGTTAFNTTVASISQSAGGGFTVETRDARGEVSTIEARQLVLAAGLGGSAIGASLSYPGGYRVPRTYPAKGHYFALSGRAPFSHLIYPVPHGAWLGIHLTLDVSGRARFGPDISWNDKIDYAFDDADEIRLARFEQEIRRYWPGLPDGALQPDSTGIRPKIYAEGEPVADFAIHGAKQHGIDGLVALYGIESPGLTSCLAIGDYVAGMLASQS